MKNKLYTSLEDLERDFSESYYYVKRENDSQYANGIKFIMANLVPNIENSEEINGIIKYNDSKTEFSLLFLFEVTSLNTYDAKYSKIGDFLLADVDGIEIIDGMTDEDIWIDEYYEMPKEEALRYFFNDCESKVDI